MLFKWKTLIVWVFRCRKGKTPVAFLKLRYYNYKSVRDLTNEQQILQNCLKRDPKAELELYNMYRAYMMGICRRYIPDRDQALDVFQEGFIRVFESLHTFRSASSLKTWMSRIFIYTAINFLRKEKKFRDHIRLDVIYNESLEALQDDGLYDASLEGHEAEQVLGKMQELPENYRLVLNLYAIDGLDHGQISEALGISESHSRVVLTRARRMLVALLNKKNNEVNLSKNR